MSSLDERLNQALYKDTWKERAAPPTRIFNGPVFELLDLMDDADGGNPYKIPMIGPIKPYGSKWKETDDSRTV